jgi:hypothetical protein
MTRAWLNRIATSSLAVILLAGCNKAACTPCSRGTHPSDPTAWCSRCVPNSDAAPPVDSRTDGGDSGSGG